MVCGVRLVRERGTYSASGDTYALAIRTDTYTSKLRTATGRAVSRALEAVSTLKLGSLITMVHMYGMNFVQSSLHAAYGATATSAGPSRSTRNMTIINIPAAEHRMTETVSMTGRVKRTLINTEYCPVIGIIASTAMATVH